MLRKRRKQQAEIEIDAEVPPDLVQFDDVLSRELDAPTILELEDDLAVAGMPTVAGPAAGTADVGRPSAAVDSTEAENALLRAELLALSPVTQQQPAPTPAALAVEPGQQMMPPISWSGVDQPDLDAANPPEQIDLAVDSNAQQHEIQLSESGARVSQPVTPVPPPGHEMLPLERSSEPGVPSSPIRGLTGFEQYNFWDRYEEATASAELFTVPPAAITVVIGALDVGVPVAERCQAGHWVSDCDVFVLTEQEYVVGQPTWTCVRRPSDVVAVLEDGRSDFPLLVIDVPRELPAWVRPLVTRLRAGGVGLVHYVLGDSPSDEDLATWHGELGRPSVLDLASPVPPGRVLELLDRGEPVSSVAGMPISTELLLALRLNGA